MRGELVVSVPGTFWKEVVHVLQPCCTEVRPALRWDGNILSLLHFFTSASQTVLAKIISNDNWNDNMEYCKCVNNHLRSIWK